MWDWNSSWYLHTVILKLTHLLHYAGAAGELFPFWRGRLETTVWIFFFYKLTCWNPVPSQPYCTGTAVLWVRSIFQVGGIWAAGVWLFIQTEHVGGMKSGSLLQVDGVLYPLHFFKMQWVYCLHLSLLYTYLEHDCLFGFLFIFPDTLNRIQTQICSSGCCLLDFLIVENYLIA